jgi:hypothetical protein
MSHRPAASRVWLAVAWAGPFAFVGARVSGVRCGVSTTFHACLSSSIYVCLVLINWFRLVSVGRRMPFLPAKVPELVSVAGGLLHSSFTVRLSSQRKLGKSGRKSRKFLSEHVREEGRAPESKHAPESGAGGNERQRNEHPGSRRPLHLSAPRIASRTRECWLGMCCRHGLQ